MDKRQAKIEALRSVAGIAENSPGAGYEPTDNEEDNKKVFAEMQVICDELLRRAAALESKATKPRAISRAKWEKEVRKLCAASTRGKPFSIRKMNQYREMDEDAFNRIADEERALARRELNPFSF